MATEAERGAFESEWREHFGNDDTVGMNVAWIFWQAAIDYANQIMPAKVQQGITWIPVSEAVPDESENEVLVLTTDGIYCIAWATWRHYTDGTPPHFDHWSFSDPEETADVSFWAKLPAKPEGFSHD